MRERPLGVSVCMSLLFLGLSAKTLLSAVTDPPPGVTYANSAMVLGFFIYVTVGGFILLTFYNGMNWARLLVLIFSGLTILSVVLTLRQTWALRALYPLWALNRLYDFAISIFFLIYLNLSPVRAWFSTRTALRRAASRA